MLNDLQSRLKLVLDPQPTPAAAPEPVDELLIERDAALAALARWGKFDDQLNEADQARQAASAALRTFQDEETAQLRLWAETGKGSAPTRNREAHTALLAALDNAERAHEAAVAARATVEAPINIARATLRAAQNKIDHRLAHAIAADAIGLIAALQTHLDAALVIHSRILACREALLRKGSTDVAGSWSSAAQRLMDVKNIYNLAPTTAEVAAHVALWRDRIEGRAP
jgi:hypothetical protein